MSHLIVMTDDDAQIMTGQQVADLLQVSPRTLEEWRQTPGRRIDARMLPGGLRRVG